MFSRFRIIILLLTLPILIISLTLISFSWLHYRHLSTLKTTLKKDFQVEQLQQRLQHLTHFTRSMRLKRLMQYHRFEAYDDQMMRELNTLWTQALKIVPTLKQTPLMEQLDQYHAQLLVMDYKAFELIKQGQINKAQTLINSQSYRQIQAQFNQTIEQFQAYLDNFVDQQVVAAQNWARLLMGKMLALIVVLLGFWSLILIWLWRYTKHLQANEARINAVIRYLVDGVIVINHQGIIESVNQAVTKLFGYSRDELVGHKVNMLMPEPYCDEHDQYLQHYLTGGEAKVIGIGREVLGKRKDGSTFPLQLSISEVKNKDKHLFTGIVRDITQQKTLESNLIAERKRAEATNQLKTEFLANMSHEIRTPMSAIIGMTELTLETELQPLQKQYLTNVATSAKNLLELLNDILDLSKIEGEHLELEQIEFDLRQLLETVIDMSSTLAQRKGLKLLLYIDPELSIFFTGDPQRLRQIVVNLVGNAIKFTEQGQVLVKAQAEASQVLLSVSDTGIGIPAERQDKIFNSFTQADGSISRQYGGSGLGLTITQQLVALMGGTIWLESQVGQGSTFYCRLPLAPSTGESLQKAQQLRDQPRYHCQPLNILVAEDNPINQLLIETRLKQYGHQVTIAHDGNQVVEHIMFNQQRFQVVLMDIQMPKMDGFEATRIIRAQEAQTGEHVPIIAMTANAMKGDREQCLQAGMDNYLTKPIDFQALFAVLAEIHPQYCTLVNLETVPLTIPQMIQTQPSIIQAELPSLAIIDWPVGRQRWGDEAVLHKALIHFVAHHADDVSQIRQALQAQAFETALQMTHALRGSASNLAAQALAHATETLELMIRQQLNIEALESGLTQVSQALAQLNAQVQQLPPEETQTITEQIIDVEKLKALLTQLDEWLKTGQATQAEACLLELKQYGNLEKTQIEQLTQAIDDFDFTAAQQVLAQMIQHNC